MAVIGLRELYGEALERYERKKNLATVALVDASLAAVEAEATTT